MSTSIDVYPTSTYQPSVSEVRDRVTQLYNEILAPHDVPYELEVRAYLSGSEEPIAPGDTTRWLPDMGATFAYCVSEKAAAWSWPCCLLDTPSEREHYFPPDDWKGWIDPAVLERARSIPHSWSDERRMGGLTVASIGYGLVAAAIAERVDGLIASWDSAFEFSMNGSVAERFLPFWIESQLGFYGVEDFQSGFAFRYAFDESPDRRR